MLTCSAVRENSNTVERVAFVEDETGHRGRTRVEGRWLRDQGEACRASGTGQGPGKGSSGDGGRANHLQAQAFNRE